MEQNTENFTLQLPEKTAEFNKTDVNKIAGFAIIAFGITLILISIAVHLGILASFAEYFCSGEKVQSALLSTILPEFTKREAFSEPEKSEIHIDTSPSTQETEVSPSSPDEDNTTLDAPIKNSVSRDLSTKNPHGFALKNETTYNPDLEVLWSSPNPIEKTDKLWEKYTEAEPLVLISHNHATESYNDTNDSGAYRSADPERNMIAVGQILSETLENNSIKTLHLTEMFDADSYNDAYFKSAAAVEKTIKKYPSIRYILDIHRDSVIDENGNCISADFTYNGITAAQMMFVVGTDEGGSGHTDWRNNLTAVLHLQDRLCSKAPSSMRAVNLRKASFYQDKSAGAMLVEIGTAGNTLSEAKRSAEIFAQALADYMMGKEIG